jgi:hypothetical protein
VSGADVLEVPAVECNQNIRIEPLG